ncbi:MAG: isoprenylcysteine carboxylmethyltransferase family protein [Bacteroidales bacterium]|jgi:protein-S-isoprenylcysteine O-methyltransferase Ste14|nr:isoprenylcysteine carboxylmethyltransferase family protein [Bacteroidales bacterium]
MALIHSFEKTGNILFRYRGQIPVLFFMLALPIVYLGHYDFFFSLSAEEQIICSRLVWIISLGLSACGFAIRAYTIGTTPRGTSGRNTTKQEAVVLNTRGIYSIVRHPLYLGNYLMWGGVLLFSMNIYIVIIFSLLFWLYYERIMFAEEKYLEKLFGDQFITWSLQTPAFLPAFSHFKKSDIPFSFKAVLRREYTGFFAIVLVFTIMDYLKAYTFSLHHGQPSLANNPCRVSLYVLAISALIMLVLRTLKHHTRVLAADENRD